MAVSFCVAEMTLPEAPAGEAGRSSRTGGDFNQIDGVVKQPGGEETGMKRRTIIKGPSNQRVSGTKKFF